MNGRALIKWLKLCAEFMMSAKPDDLASGVY